MHQILFRLGLRPRPLLGASLQRSPRSPSCIRRGLLQREREVEGEKVEGKGRGGEGKGKERGGNGREFGPPIFMTDWRLWAAQPLGWALYSRMKSYNIEQSTYVVDNILTIVNFIKQFDCTQHRPTGSYSVDRYSTVSTTFARCQHCIDAARKPQRDDLQPMHDYVT